MKEPISEANTDIDSGWDEIAPSTPPVSITVKAVDSQPPAVEELDAGWDVEPATLAKPAEKAKAPKSGVVISGSRSEPPTNSQVSLTRKAKKELERQAKYREAQRKAEARAQRKVRRRIIEATPVIVAPSAAGKLPKQEAQASAKQSTQSRPKKKRKPVTRVHRQQGAEGSQEELGSSQREPVAIALENPKPSLRSLQKSSATTKILVGVLVVALVAAIILLMR